MTIDPRTLPPRPLTHDEAEQLVSASMDAPLAAPDQQALAAHLASCPQCRAFAGQMTTLIRGMASLPSYPPSAAVGRQVRDRILSDAPATPGGRRGPARPAWVAPMAAILVLALGGLIAVAVTRLTGDDTDLAAPKQATVALGDSGNGSSDDGVDPSPTIPNIVVAIAESETATLPPIVTATPVAVVTDVPTETPTTLPTDTPVPSDTPVPTDTPSPTDTATTLPSETPLPTDTPTVAPTDTAIPTGTPTAVPTGTPEPTDTAIPTETASTTETETATASPTPSTAPEATSTGAPGIVPMGSLTAIPAAAEPANDAETATAASGNAIESTGTDTSQPVTSAAAPTIAQVGDVSGDGTGFTGSPVADETLTGLGMGAEGNGVLDQAVLFSQLANGITSAPGRMALRPGDNMNLFAVTDTTGGLALSGFNTNVTSLGIGTDPVWSPAGGVLAFTDLTSGSSRVTLWDAETGGFATLDPEFDPATMADLAGGWIGSQVVYQRTWLDGSGRVELRIADADGSGEALLWSRDGAAILSAHPIELPGGIAIVLDDGWHLVDAAGNDTIISASGGRPVGDAVISPDGATIAYDSGGAVVIASAYAPGDAISAVISPPDGPSNGFAFPLESDRIVIASTQSLSIYTLDGTLVGTAGSSTGGSIGSPRWTTEGILYIDNTTSAVMVLDPALVSEP